VQALGHTAVVTLQTESRPPGELPAARRLLATIKLREILAAVVGFGCGVSVFLNGFYDLAVFGWIGLGLLSALVFVVAGPGVPSSRPLVLALAGLVALWAWALLSSTWAQSFDQAMLVANRWLTYAAFLGVTAWLVRGKGTAVAFLCGVAVAGMTLLVYLFVELLGHGGPDLFVAQRLADPVGYVNALGTYLLIAAFWPAIALAERARPLPASAIAAGIACFAASLLILTQSRGVAVATALSIVVVVAAVPGRLLRVWLLLAVAAGVAVAAPTMLHVYGSHVGVPTALATQHAAVASALAATGVAIVWGSVLLVLRSLPSHARPSVRKAATGCLLLLVVAGLIVLAVFSGRITHEVNRQYEVFTHPGQSVSAASSTTRLTSGAGNRYDLWRVAWNDFTDHPINGVGAGNWPVSYFRERRTTENVRQPHSIELQALSELGIVGGLFLLVFVVGVYWGLARRHARSRGDATARAVTVAACGAFTGWLVHTSVDWMTLMPGLTGIALISAAALVVGPEPSRGRRGLALPVLGLVLILIGVGAAFLARQTLADRYRIDAQAVLAKTPRQTIRDANHALALNDDLLAAYYVKAAAYARLDDYTSSRATLLAAADREPQTWLTWALLGDLAARRGDFRAARAAYGRAHGLNPRDGSLEQLVRKPQLALQSAP
jgi:hypothetical protein